MNGTWLRIGGVLLVATAFFLLLTNLQQGLRPFGNVVFPIDDSLVSTERDIAHALSYALWGKRLLDAILLGLLLFLASACSAAMLSPQSGRKR